MLAQVARCVDPAFCPTDDEILEAVWGWDLERATDATNAAAARDEIVIIHPRRPEGIGNVVCGEPTGEAAGVSCAMTVRYTGGDLYQVARLERRADGWTAVDVLGVWRERVRSSGSAQPGRIPAHSAR